LQLAAISQLVELRDVELSESQSHLMQAILNLVDFESGRLLIQEVNSNMEIDLPTFKAPAKGKARFGSHRILSEEPE